MPADALVCDVGGTEWRAVSEVAPFTKAFAELDGSVSSPPGAGSRKPEPTLVDPPTIPPGAGDGPAQKFSLPQFDDVAEKTVVEDAPNWSERP